MCQETLELHHGKHHNAYVTALNGFVAANPALQGKSLEEIVKLSYSDTALAGVFNNAGQHWNHIVFWENMSPTGGGSPGALEAKINADYGSVQAYKDAFKTAVPPPRALHHLAPPLQPDQRQHRLRRHAEVPENPERLQPARHRRRQGPAGL